MSKIKIQDLTINELMWYKRATEDLLSIYQNEVCMAYDEQRKEYDGAEQKRRKYSGIKDLIIKELERRADLLC